MAVTNLGAQRLGEKVGAFGSIRKLAKALGHDFATVYRWINKGQLPEYEGRKSARDVCGIELDDWDKPAAETKGAA